MRSGFWKTNWPIFLILIMASFLRLYQIADYMTFLGDEGRDAIVWLRMVREGKFVLIGPVTSIGNMYLGPLYYYLMLPFFFLFGLSPVGPSVGVAIFSVATTFLIYWFGKEWFGKFAGLLSAFLYALSPVVILHSRSSWNPNVMPFFALLTIWGIWQFWQRKNFWGLPLVGVTLSFAIQSHYLGLLLIPLTAAFWLLTLREVYGKDLFRQFIAFSLLSCLLFVILTILPLVWFDLRHNFLNYHAFQKFFGDRQTTVNLKFYKAIPNLWPLWEMMVTRLLTAKEMVWGRIVAVGLILGLVFMLWRSLWRSDLSGGRTSLGKALILILVWIGIGLAGMGLYKQHIYDHYFGFLFPGIFLLTGAFLGIIWRYGKPAKLLVIGSLLLVLWLDFQNSPLRNGPNFQLRRVQEVDRKIITEAGGRPFNLGLIAKQNYEAGYDFFLELWDKKPSQINPQRFSETITDQLFVICEDPVCEPINHPKAEIANFGWSKIEQEWQFPWGVRLFKLVHNPEGKR